MGPGDDETGLGQLPRLHGYDHANPHVLPACVLSTVGRPKAPGSGAQLWPTFSTVAFTTSNRKLRTAWVSEHSLTQTSPIWSLQRVL